MAAKSNRFRVVDYGGWLRRFAGIVNWRGVRRALFAYLSMGLRKRYLAGHHLCCKLWRALRNNIRVRLGYSANACGGRANLH